MSHDDFFLEKLFPRLEFKVSSNVQYRYWSSYLYFMKFDIYRKQVRYWSYFEHFNNSTYFPIIRYLKLLHDNLEMIVYVNFHPEQSSDSYQSNCINGVWYLEHQF